MRSAALLFALVLGLSCTFSPVVTTKEERPWGARYSDCKRAAEAYCRDAVGATGGEFDKCAAKSAFECVSGLGSPK